MHMSKIKKIVKEENIINKKNYLILAVIFILTISFTLYLCKLFIVYKEYQKEIPVISGSLLEITKEELEHYVIDNPSVVVYMCSATKDECRSFEKKLKKYVKKMEINDEMIYLNLTNEDLDTFIQEFNKKYSSKNKLTSNIPAFAYFNDGKLEALLQENKTKNITISKMKSFLELVWADEEEIEQENIEESN